MNEVTKIGPAIYEAQLDYLAKFVEKNYEAYIKPGETAVDVAIKLLEVANTPVFRYQLLDKKGQRRRPEVMADLVEALMVEMGVPMTQGDCANSPLRISKGFLELTDSYGKEPPIVKCFPRECKPGQLMMVKNIEYSSLCEHHMLPFIGQVDIGYIVGKKVIGLSKPARLVGFFAHRLMIQERFLDDVIGEIMKQTESPAVFIRIEAEHLCSKIRGVKANDQDAVNYVDRYSSNWSRLRYQRYFDVFVRETCKGGDTH